MIALSLPIPHWLARWLLRRRMRRNQSEVLQWLESLGHEVRYD